MKRSTVSSSLSSSSSVKAGRLGAIALGLRSGLDRLESSPVNATQRVKVSKVVMIGSCPIAPRGFPRDEVYPDTTGFATTDRGFELPCGLANPCEPGMSVCLSQGLFAAGQSTFGSDAFHFSLHG